MFAVAKLATSTISKVAPTVGKTVAKTALSTAVKLPLTALKLTSSMMSMVGGGILGAIMLLYQLSK